jgi:guanylate kinase
LVIVGASGAGKGTIVKHLLKKFPEYFKLSVSWTTRNMREGEQNGREYHFVTHEKFN